MRKVALLLVVFAAMLVLSFGSVLAATPGEGDVVSDSDLGEYSFGAGDQTVDVTSGSIRNVDLDTNMSTYRWSGLLGNVSGNIVLGDSSNEILFSWVAEGRIVYATEAANPAWASVVAEDGTNIAAYIDGSGSDNYTNTFNTTGDLGSGILTAGSLATAPRATTLGGTGWYTYALHDGSANIFAGNVIPAGDTSYSGSSVQYQMIVPEDGTNGDLAATSYNLWVELQ